MAYFETWVNRDLKKVMTAEDIRGTVFTLDNLGNLIGVRVFSDGQPVTLSGSVNGYCILADGTTVPVAGTRSGNEAYIILPQSAYAVPGMIRIAIKLTEGSTITTLAALIGSVAMSRTDNMITPSSQVITDWSQQIAAEMQAVEDASAAQDVKISDLKQALDILGNDNRIPINAGWTRAAINSDGTLNTSAVWRLTSDIVYYDRDVKVYFESGYSVQLATYTSSDVFVSRRNISSGEIILKGTHFRVSIYKSNEAVTDDPTYFYNEIKISSGLSCVCPTQVIPSNYQTVLPDLNNVYKTIIYNIVTTPDAYPLNAPKGAYHSEHTIFANINRTASDSSAPGGTFQVWINDKQIFIRSKATASSWGSWNLIVDSGNQLFNIFKGNLGHIVDAAPGLIRAVAVEPTSNIHVCGANLLDKNTYTNGYYDANGFHSNTAWRIFIVPNWKYGKFRASGFPAISGAQCAYLNSYDATDFGEVLFATQYINRKIAETNKNYPFIGLCVYLPNYDPDGAEMASAMVTYEADRDPIYEAFDGSVFSSASDIVLRKGVNNIFTEDGSVVGFHYQKYPAFDIRIRFDCYSVSEFIYALKLSKKQRMDIYLHGGDYDIIAGMSAAEDLESVDGIVNSDGLWLGNDVYITADPGVRLIANYTGSWQYMNTGFAIFNSHGDGGFTLDGLTLVGSNIRYLVHDDPTDYEGYYKNVYRNCHFIFDNQNNPNWASNCAIGGGLGKSGEIIVENCIFEIPDGSTRSEYEMLAYHNSSHPQAKSIITYKGNMLINCGCAVTWYGPSTKKTEVIITNNKMPINYMFRAETSEYQDNCNMVVHAWNNVIGDE